MDQNITVAMAQLAVWLNKSGTVEKAKEAMLEALKKMLT